MIGVIDTGGGLRSIYGAGIFDRCLDEHITFDLCIGVSAGSANVASFLGKQKGRNYRFFTEYANRKEYMSMENFRHCGAYIDLDYVFSELSDSTGEDPLDYESFDAYRGKLFVVGTKESGEAHYFTKEDVVRDDYHIFQASSALPFVCKPYTDGETVYYDGGIADPIPLEKAMAEGCERCVVILSRPVDEEITGIADHATAAALAVHHPALSRTLHSRLERYKSALQKALELQQAGKCLVLAPDDRCGVQILTKDVHKLHALYEKGYHDAAVLQDFLCKV